LKENFEGDEEEDDEEEQHDAILSELLSTETAFTGAGDQPAAEN